MHGSLARRAMLMLLGAVLLMLLVPDVATAAPAVQKCTDPGLTNKLVACIRTSIDSAAGKFFTDFYPVVQAAIGAVMTLSVIVYGILLSYGLVEKVGRDTIVLGLKLIGVVAFSSSSPLIYDMTIKMMDGAAAAVVSYVPPSSAVGPDGKTTYDQATCVQVMSTTMEDSDTERRIIGPWLGMDCLIDSVIGIRVMDGNVAQQGQDKKWYNDMINPEKRGLSRSLAYLFFSGMQSSTIGIILGVIGFVFMWGLLMMIVKAIFTYIAGYMGVALMVIISPLFIPLILFQVTKIYFDKWVKVLISFAIQPIVMMAFIVFSMAAVDFAAFSGKYSIWHAIAGDAAGKKGFDLNKYLTEYRDKNGNVIAENQSLQGSQQILSLDRRVVAEVKSDNPTPAKSTSTDTGGVAPDTSYYVCTPSAIENSKKLDPEQALFKYCNNKYPISLKMRSINWNLMARARTEPPVTPLDGTSSDEDFGKQIAREVLSAAMFCAFVVMILKNLLSVLPMVAYDLMGDYGQSADIASIGGDLAKGMPSGGGFAKSISNKVQELVKK